MSTIKCQKEQINRLSCYKAEKLHQTAQRTWTERSRASHQSPSDNFPQDLPVRMLWFSKCSVASDKWRPPTLHPPPPTPRVYVMSYWTSSSPIMHCICPLASHMGLQGLSQIFPSAYIRSEFIVSGRLDFSLKVQEGMMSDCLFSRFETFFDNSNKPGFETLGVWLTVHFVLCLSCVSSDQSSRNFYYWLLTRLTLKNVWFQV